MSLRDPQERYNNIREQVIDMLIEYDEFVRDTHKDLIETAKRMTDNTPLFPRDQKDVPSRSKTEEEHIALMKRYRYLNTPIFRLTVDRLTSYIMTNTVQGDENEQKRKEEWLRVLLGRQTD